MAFATNVNALKKRMIDYDIRSISQFSRMTGINRTTLSSIMNGQKQPSMASMERIIDVLHISPDECGPIFFNDNLRNKQVTL